MNEIKNTNHPMYGKKHSEKSKKLMSIAHTGKTLTIEHRKKISDSLKGFKRSEENCRNISSGLRGKYIGENASMYGRKHTTATKRKMSEAMHKKWETDKTWYCRRRLLFETHD